MAYDDFTDEDRRALLLIRCYEVTRQESGQRGYTVFPRDCTDPRLHKAFGQFRTVVAWLHSKGWSVTWKEVNWMGFVRFVFEHMKPSVPYPGQLKNEMLLRTYLGSTTVCEAGPPERTPEQLERIYSRVVDKRIYKDLKASAALGIRRV